MTDTQNPETKLISEFLTDKDVRVTKNAYKHRYLWRCNGANCERDTKTTQYQIRSGGRLVIYDYSICCFHDFAFANRCQWHRVSNFNADGGLTHTHCAKERNYIPRRIRRQLNIIALRQRLQKVQLQK